MDSNNYNNVLSNLYRKAGDRSHLTSCENELQELLRQIDHMIKNNQIDWENKIKNYQSQVERRDRELSLQSITLEQRHQEIGQLKQQIEGMERSQEDIVSDYEQQANTLRMELTNIKSDYEKLHKKHTKQQISVEKQRDQISLELESKISEISQMNARLDEYMRRTKDLEAMCRNYQDKTTSLESQRASAIAKCDQMQDQVMELQTQLNKYRQQINNMEQKYNAQVSQLESQLLRSKSSYETQEDTLRHLKGSLDEALGTNREQSNDMTDLQNKLRRAHGIIQEREDDIAHQRIELQSKSDIIRELESDRRQHSDSVLRLEDTIRQKDLLITSLEESNDKRESALVQKLRSEVIRFQAELESRVQNEKSLLEEVKAVHARHKLLESARKELASAKVIASQKDEAFKNLEEVQFKQLLSENVKLRERITHLEETYAGKEEGMRKELSSLTAKLHQREATMAVHGENASNLESDLRKSRMQEITLTSELKNGRSQNDLLRRENRKLQEQVNRQQIQASEELKAVEKQLAALRNEHISSIARLQEENRQLYNDLVSLKLGISRGDQSMLERYYVSPDRADSIMKTTPFVKDDRIIQLSRDTEQRINDLQNRLDTTINEYEKKAKYYEHKSPKRSPLQNIVIDDTLSPSKISPISARSESANLMSTSGTSPQRYGRTSRNTYYGEYTNKNNATNSSFTLIDQGLSDNKYEVSHRPPSQASIATDFKAKEEYHSKDLERILNSHIANFKSEVDRTVNMYSNTN